MSSEVHLPRIERSPIQAQAPHWSEAATSTQAPSSPPREGLTVRGARPHGLAPDHPVRALWSSDPALPSTALLCHRAKAVTNRH